MKLRAIKTKARILLRGNYERFGLMVLLYGGIRLLCTILPAFIFTAGELVYITVMTLITTYLLQLIVSIFSAGLSKAALSVSRETEFQFSNIIYAFSNSTNQFVKLQLILTGIGTVLQLPNIILYNLNIIGYTVYYVLALAASFVSLLIVIKLRFSIYALLDDPQLSASEALRKSISLTNGNYLRILKMDISFIPMHFLAICSFAFGYILVLPYVETSNAIMYGELVKGQSSYIEENQNVSGDQNDIEVK